MNILVCDDDQAIVDAIGIYLENEGYKVFKAFNGKEAIQYYRRKTHPFDYYGYYDATNGWHYGDDED